MNFKERVVSILSSIFVNISATIVTGVFSLAYITLRSIGTFAEIVIDLICKLGGEKQDE